jgi:hypothetical protein
LTDVLLNGSSGNTRRRDITQGVPDVGLDR